MQNSTFSLSLSLSRLSLSSSLEDLDFRTLLDCRLQDSLIYRAERARRNKSISINWKDIGKEERVRFDHKNVTEKK